jgi:hypothetical protein
MDLLSQSRRVGGLSEIAASHVKDFLKKLLVAFAAAGPQSEVVLDHAVNDGLLQLVSDFFPGKGGLRVSDRISATF